MESAAPPEGHPVANEACSARAVAGRVYFEGGEITGLAAVSGTVLRCSEPVRTGYGIAQVRRLAESAQVRLLHVLFAPALARPLLLSLVRVENRTDELLRLDYNEAWDVSGERTRAGTGACVCNIAESERALADASMVIRGQAVDPLPRRGLALVVRFMLPPRARRELSFAYAAPAPGEFSASLVRAWRGEAPAELSRSVEAWGKRLGVVPNRVEAYRVEASGWPL